jgi:hypothetical protein
MKYIKLFEEATNVPDYFVELESINHYLDSKSGVIYPILKSGGYDERNDFDLEAFTSGFEETQIPRDAPTGNISHEDQMIIDQYRQSTEKYFKDKINWDLIDLAKERSLDIIDNGGRLLISVSAQVSTKSSFFIYYEDMTHTKPKQSWNMYFEDSMSILSNYTGELIYNIQLFKILKQNPLPWGDDFTSYKSVETETSELIELLNRLYPDENIKNFNS